MSLEPAVDPSRLYWAVGSEVNEHRPFFTGDIFTDVEIPGVGGSPAMIIGHPCSIRGRQGNLTERIPVASVASHDSASADRWASGFFNRMPLAGLPLDGSFHVARLDSFGLVAGETLWKRNAWPACLTSGSTSFSKGWYSIKPDWKCRRAHFIRRLLTRMRRLNCWRIGQLSSLALCPSPYQVSRFGFEKDIRAVNHSWSLPSKERTFAVKCAKLSVNGELNHTRDWVLASVMGAGTSFRAAFSPGFSA